MSLDQRLLAALSHGSPRSPGSLAVELGATTDRVRRRLRRLLAAGWPITAGGDAGYRLDPSVRVLHPDRIESGLVDVADCLDRLVFWPQIDSTQMAIAGEPVRDDGRAVVAIADRQTAGHGRRGRGWHAPAGGAITLSLARYLPQPPSGLGALAPGLGLAVAEALRARGVAGVGVKWPNDVLIDGAKVAGVLVDAVGARNSGARVVVGVGANFALGEPRDRDGRTDLCSALTQPPPRSEWVVAIVRALLMRLSQAARYGPATALAGWCPLDAYRDRRVRVTTSEEAVDGVAAGVDEAGALQVDTAAGRRRFISADVSLRAVEPC